MSDKLGEPDDVHRDAIVNGPSDPDVPPIDIADVTETLGTEDREAHRDYIREFLMLIVHTVEKLDDAIKAEDRNALSAAAHKASGSSKYAGAIPLSRVYHEIEILAHKASWEELSVMIEAAKKQLLRIEEFVESL